MRYEVRCGHPEDYEIVVRRSSKAAALEDCSLLGMFGRKAWIVEVV